MGGKKKKKINVLSWLNTNIEATISFKTWVDALCINGDHLQFLMKNSIVETFQTILEENLTSTSTSSNNSNNIPPIKCFSQKTMYFMFIN